MKHYLTPYSLRLKRKGSTDYVRFGELSTSDVLQEPIFTYLAKILDPKSLSPRNDKESQRYSTFKELRKSISEQRLFGIVESGEYGIEKSIVDTNTGEEIMRQKPHQADSMRFCFGLFLPNNSAQGYLVIHRIGVHGVSTFLKQYLSNELRSALGSEIILEIQPVFDPDYLKNVLNGVRVRAVTFKSTVHQDLADKINSLHDSPRSYYQIYSLRATRNSNIPFIDKTMKALSRNKIREEFIEYAPEDFGPDCDVDITLNIEGKDKTFKSKNALQSAMNVELKDVKFGPDGNPDTGEMETAIYRMISEWSVKETF